MLGSLNIIFFMEQKDARIILGISKYGKHGQEYFSVKPVKISESQNNK